jgi:glycosyltransferase involved in cell wall biosynthesis
VKIVHVPFCFYPNAVGGTEVYVASLASLLAAEQGWDMLIAAPAARTEEYRHGSTRVRRYATATDVADVGELYGEGDELAATEFGKMLAEERPDIVHLHAFTRGVSLKVLRNAKARSIPVVFTYHTPTVTCTRGTMMKWGSVVSDGIMLGRRCTACTLHGLGMNRIGAEIIASMPRPARNLLANNRKSGGIWTALRMRELIEKRHAATRMFLNEVDHIVAVCDWVRDVLIRNGVPAKRITLCRQGIESREHGARSGEHPPSHKATARQGDQGIERADNTNALPERFTADRPLRLVFFGRLHPTKGLHVLIEALRLDESLPVRLDIYGTAQGEGGEVYTDRIRKLAAGDPRIEFKSPVPPEDVIPVMREYDMVVVPSQWLETGPLVVIEAFAAGLPVLGSNLGGIAELVQHNVNGCLVAPSPARDWLAALRRIVVDPNLIRQWQRELPPSRTIQQVAAEMTQLYQSLLQRKHSVSHVFD